MTTHKESIREQLASLFWKEQSAKVSESTDNKIKTIVEWATKETIHTYTDTDGNKQTFSLSMSEKEEFCPIDNKDAYLANLPAEKRYIAMQTINALTRNLAKKYNKFLGETA